MCGTHPQELMTYHSNLMTAKNVVLVPFCTGINKTKDFTIYIIRSVSVAFHFQNPVDGIPNFENSKNVPMMKMYHVSSVKLKKHSVISNLTS